MVVLEALENVERFWMIRNLFRRLVIALVLRIGLVQTQDSFFNRQYFKFLSF